MLNSDVKIVSDLWLEKLSFLINHAGIASFGVVLSPIKRADGYCMLIRREIYDKFLLNEKFQWWWSVTELEAKVLHVGYSIIAVENHQDYLIHYGGKSKIDLSNDKTLKNGASSDEVLKWFDGIDKDKILILPFLDKNRK